MPFLLVKQMPIPSRYDITWSEKFVYQTFIWNPRKPYFKFKTSSSFTALYLKSSQNVFQIILFVWNHLFSSSTENPYTMPPWKTGAVPSVPVLCCAKVEKIFATNNIHTSYIMLLIFMNMFFFSFYLYIHMLPELTYLITLRAKTQATSSNKDILVQVTRPTSFGAFFQK